MELSGVLKTTNDSIGYGDQSSSGYRDHRRQTREKGFADILGRMMKRKDIQIPPRRKISKKEIEVPRWPKWSDFKIERPDRMKRVRKPMKEPTPDKNIRLEFLTNSWVV